MAVTGPTTNFSVLLPYSEKIYGLGSQNLYKEIYGISGNISSPTLLGSDLSWSAFAAGEYNTLFVKSNGTLWAWGYNNSGQLGTNNTTDQTAPVQIGTDSNWTSVSTGYLYSGAIKTDGTLWMWGDNTYGQLGDNSARIHRSSPYQIGALTNWKQVSCGIYSTGAIKTDGTLWTWGDNTRGALADNTSVAKSSPVQVGSLTNWSSVSSAFDSTQGHMLALKTDGSIWGWGFNDAGQLGTKNTTTYSSPVLISSDSWSKILTGDKSSAAIKSDGTLWVWGYNYYGGLGLNDTTNRSSPVQLGTDTWLDIAPSRYRMEGIKSNRTLWTWGDNSYGELGLGNKVHRSSPTQVGSLTNWNKVFAGLSTSYAISSPEYQDLGQRYVSKDYLIDVYPNIAYNVLGNRITPALYMSGYNAFGQLGSNDRTDRSSPTQVGSLTNWKLVSCGFYHAGAIKTDGTLWTWGNNGNGALGDNSARVHRSSPYQIGALTNWRLISAGSDFSGAIKTDGTLWMWGVNDSGQLGDNSARVNRSSPFQIGALTNWKQVSTGGSHSSSVKTDGTLWLWGNNGSGQLGDNSARVSRSSPYQIGALTNWKLVSCGQYHTAAVKTDGTLWAWGHNNYGQLGDNSARVHRSSPYQIGALTNWKLVSAGLYHTAAIKTDGTLWSWGYNAVGGTLGLGDGISRSSPVQVGSLSNWKLVSCGLYDTSAIKTDGTLWVLGINTYGQLGDNTVTARSSPYQIGVLTSWKQTSSGIGSAAGQLRRSSMAAILDWNV